MSSGERGVENIEPSGTAAREDQEQEYSVEIILDKRLNNNKVEYFIKWIGYDDRENCWEPEENLNCVDLINAFEERLKREEKKRKRREKRENRALFARLRELSNTIIQGSTSVEPIMVSTMIKLDKKVVDKFTKTSNGSEVTEKIPDKILGASNSSGQLMFLMKWQGTEESDLISAAEANLMYPEVVIDFYESRLTWNFTTRGVN